jgi:hypothetical protein
MAPPRSGATQRESYSSRKEPYTCLGRNVGQERSRRLRNHRAQYGCIKQRPLTSSVVCGAREELQSMTTQQRASQRESLIAETFLLLADSLTENANLSKQLTRLNSREPASLWESRSLHVPNRHKSCTGNGRPRRHHRRARQKCPKRPTDGACHTNRCGRTSDGPDPHSRLDTSTTATTGVDDK